MKSTKQHNTNRPVSDGQVKKSKFKGKYHDKKTDEVKDLKGCNDFAWYNLNPDLTNKAARIPFGRPLGNTVEIRIDGVTDQWNATMSNTFVVPGIVSFRMVPSIGCSVDGVQTVDVAAKSIYSWVRHANSGHANYDSTDLMIYLLAAGNIYAAAGFLLKTYSCINSYNPTSRYMPRAVLEAMGWNVDLLIEHIADFRYFCAQWFKKAQVLFTPKKFPYFEKAFWMYTQLFEEDSTGKSPYYQYIPDGFYKFNATKYSSGGCLEFDPFPIPVLQTWPVVTGYFTGLLDRLIDDEDMGIMSGDIKKAFGDDVWNIGEFPFEATMNVVKDSFVLQQMHNTTPVNIWSSKLDIVQWNNQLLCFPEIEFVSDSGHTAYAYNIANTIIDIDSAVPSEEEVIEATQYSNFVTALANLTSYQRYADYISVTGYTHNTAKNCTILNCSDYFCKAVTVHYLSAGGVLSSEVYAMGAWLTPNDSTLTKEQLVQRDSMFRTMEWLPMVLTTTGLPMMSLHNYTVVERDTIANLHDCSWLSLLAIPASEHLK